MEHLRILINIDTILDTMYGTLKSINDDWVTNIPMEEYYNRNSNTFSLINQDIDDALVNYMWSDRGNDILRISKATNILGSLASNISESKKTSAVPGEKDGIKITINMYPYTISKTEIQELFIGLKEILRVDELLMVNKTPSEITPKLLNKHFDQFIIEDFNIWCEFNLERLAEDPIPNITCTAPAILMPDNIHQSDIETAILNTKISFAAHLDLDLIPLEAFSLIKEGVELC